MPEYYEQHALDGGFIISEATTISTARDNGPDKRGTAIRANVKARIELTAALFAAYHNNFRPNCT
jgi:hypothetical protein